MQTDKCFFQTDWYFDIYLTSIVSFEMNIVSYDVH